MPEKRYDKNCWCCGGKGTMVSKGNYFQCRECGATWNETPDLGMFTDIVARYTGKDREISFSPVRRRGSPKVHIRPLKKSTGGGY